MLQLLDFNKRVSHVNVITNASNRHTYPYNVSSGVFCVGKAPGVIKIPQQVLRKGARHPATTRASEPDEKCPLRVENINATGANGTRATAQNGCGYGCVKNIVLGQTVVCYQYDRTARESFPGTSFRKKQRGHVDHIRVRAVFCAWPAISWIRQPKGCG